MSEHEPPILAIDIDREGWWAIQHKDGWWMGTEQGVVCYEEYEVAQIAMTIRWQMDGGRAMPYTIRKFPGPTTAGDEVKDVKTAEQAIIDYEKRALLPAEERTSDHSEDAAG